MTTTATCAAAPLSHSRNAVAFVSSTVIQRFREPTTSLLPEPTTLCCPWRRATCRPQRPTTVVCAAASREPQHDDDDVLVSVVIDKVTRVLSAPTPGFDSLALGYPLVLATATTLLPLTTSLVLIGSFVAFLALGHRLLADTSPDTDSEDNNDSNKKEEHLVDLVALSGAVVTAGLLSPAGFAGNGVALASMSSSLFGIVGVALVGLAVASIVISPSPIDQRDEPSTTARYSSLNDELLDRWDERFQQEQDNPKKKQK